MLHRGDLFAPLAGKRYDSSSPIHPMSMRKAWPICRANAAPTKARLRWRVPTARTSSGASWRSQGAPDAARRTVVRIGRCRPALEAAFPRLPLLCSHGDSEGEVFWIAASDSEHVIPFYAWLVFLIPAD